MALGQIQVHILIDVTPVGRREVLLLVDEEEARIHEARALLERRLGHCLEQIGFSATEISKAFFSIRSSAHLPEAVCGASFTGSR